MKALVIFTLMVAGLTWGAMNAIPDADEVGTINQAARAQLAKVDR